MNDKIKEILVSEEKIDRCVQEIADKINNDFKDEEVILIGILKGSVIFMSDLARKLTLDAKMDFMAVSSYGKSSETSGVVKILKDLDFEIKGKNVIIVEDIIDSGTTLKYLIKYLGARNPKSIKVACMLDKPSRRKSDVKIDYLGCEVPDEFLVGYGLDYAEIGRCLPYVAALKEEVYKK